MTNKIVVQAWDGKSSGTPVKMTKQQLAKYLVQAAKQKAKTGKTLAYTDSRLWMAKYRCTWATTHDRGFGLLNTDELWASNDDCDCGECFPCKGYYGDEDPRYCHDGPATTAKPYLDDMSKKVYDDGIPF